MKPPALVLLGLALGGCASLGRPAEGRGAPVGQVLDVQLPIYPDGQPFDLRQQRGKVVVIDLWASWCDPCRDLLSFYEDQYQAYKEKGLLVLGVSEDEDKSQIQQFLAEAHLTFPILWDQDAKLAENVVKIRAIPTSLFIDRRGVLRFVHEGTGGMESASEIQRELEGLLAEGSP